MAKTNNTIEINGKRYDAVSGELMASGHHKPAVKTAAKTAHKAAPKPTAHKSGARQPASSVAAHAPAHAKTLMRHAVKRPAASGRSSARPNSEVTTPPLAEIVVSSPAKRVDSRRLSRAQSVPHSQLIQHFSALGLHVPEPADGVIKPTIIKPTEPAKAQTTADLLAHAVKTATSHQQPAHHAKRHSRHGHKASIAGGLAVAVLLIGVAGSQALLDLRLHVAGSKAGIDASLPNYQPPGYSLGNISYSPGEIATQFHSNSNDSAYTLLKHRTGWNNAALVDNVVAPADPSYQTINGSAHAIYLYGNRNATWVSGGVWYTIQSDGSINDGQLVDLANSL